MCVMFHNEFTRIHFFFLSKSSKEGQREGKWEGSRKRERKKGRRGTLIIEAI